MNRLRLASVLCPSPASDLSCAEAFSRVFNFENALAHLGREAEAREAAAGLLELEPSFRI